MPLPCNSPLHIFCVGIIQTMPPRAPSASPPGQKPANAKKAVRSPLSGEYEDALTYEPITSLDAVRIRAPGQPYILAKDSVRKLMEAYAEKRAKLRAELAEVQAAAARNVGAHPKPRSRSSPKSLTLFIDPFTQTKITAAEVTAIIQTEALYSELKKEKYSEFMDAVDGENMTIAKTSKKATLMPGLVKAYKDAYKANGRQPPTTAKVQQLIKHYMEANKEKIEKYAEIFLENELA